MLETFVPCFHKDIVSSMLLESVIESDLSLNMTHEHLIHHHMMSYVMQPPPLKRRCCLNLTCTWYKNRRKQLSFQDKMSIFYVFTNITLRHEVKAVSPSSSSYCCHCCEKLSWMHTLTWIWKLSKMIYLIFLWNTFCNMSRCVLAHFLQELISKNRASSSLSII